jgi:hypothetical protein
VDAQALEPRALEQLAAGRAAQVRAYLTANQGIAAARIQLGGIAEVVAEDGPIVAPLALATVPANPAQ